MLTTQLGLLPLKEHSETGSVHARVKKVEARTNCCCQSEEPGVMKANEKEEVPSLLQPAAFLYCPTLAEPIKELLSKQSGQGLEHTERSLNPWHLAQNLADGCSMPVC